MTNWWPPAATDPVLNEIKANPWLPGWLPGLRQRRGGGALIPLTPHSSDAFLRIGLGTGMCTDIKKDCNRSKCTGRTPRFLESTRDTHLHGKALTSMALLVSGGLDQRNAPGGVLFLLFFSGTCELGAEFVRGCESNRNRCQEFLGIPRNSYELLGIPRNY